MVDVILYTTILTVLAGGLIYGYLIISGSQKYGASFDRSQTEKQIAAFAKGGSFLRARYLSSDFNEIIHVYRQEELIFAEIRCPQESYERDILESILSEYPELYIENEQIISVTPKIIIDIIVKLFDELKYRDKFLRVAFF